MTRVYKVLSRGPDGNLRSVIMRETNWILYYKYRTVTIPKDNSLCAAFSTREYASRYAHLIDREFLTYKPFTKQLEVWECEASDIVNIPSLPYNLDDALSIYIFWKQYNLGTAKYDAYTSKVPEGSVFTHSIKLLHKLEVIEARD